MTIQYPAGPERKKLAAAAAKYLGASIRYAGMPSAAYILGLYTLSKDWLLTGPDDRTLVEALRQQGFVPTEEAYDDQPEAAAEPEAEEIEQTDRLTISVPRADFTADAIDRLHKLVASRRTLLEMALSAESTPVQVGETKIYFPWFPCDGNAESYAQLVTALCRTAKEKQRVNARPQKEYPNPKFAMRCWLTTTLGLVGDDYRKIRKLMCGRLEGNSAWSRGSDPRKAEKAGKNND